MKQGIDAIMQFDKIITDDNFIGFVREMVEASQTKFAMTVYYMNPRFTRKNNDVKLFCEALVAAVKRKVDVKILFNTPAPGSILTRGQKAAYSFLQSNGVPVKHSDSKRTTHAKFLLSDGINIVIGSHNFSQASLHRNREVSISLANSDLYNQLECYFLEEYYKGDEKW